MYMALSQLARGVSQFAPHLTTILSYLFIDTGGRELRAQIHNVELLQVLGRGVGEVDRGMTDLPGALY